jgi:1-acyl-sn-glycerol-3-phosphate acyltransferase
VVFFHIRVFDRRFVPKKGGAILLSNHQSFADPVLIALGLDRQVSFMARDTLFNMPGFCWLIKTLNAFPVRRGTADLKALKGAIERLKTGSAVIVFGEGTRTRDGRIGAVLPGVALLAKRGGVPVIPVVIDGAYESWPRSQNLPKPEEIRVVFGKPVPPESAGKMKNEEWADMITDTLRKMQKDIRSRYGRKPFD